MFWSDATHLTQFGNSQLWPCYLFIGNESKYRWCKPSCNSCSHIAYFQKVRAQSIWFQFNWLNTAATWWICSFFRWVYWWERARKTVSRPLSSRIFSCASRISSWQRLSRGMAARNCDKVLWWHPSLLLSPHLHLFGWLSWKVNMFPIACTISDVMSEFF